MTLWDYRGYTEPRAYGEDRTYRIGLPWLDEACETVEDWGAGLAYGRQFVTRASYLAVDSSPSSGPFVDVVENLADRVSRPDGIFMRHVLEHNTGWAAILDNAVASFRRRMVLVMFTPFASKTYPTAGTQPILDLSFRKEDLTERFGQWLVAEQPVQTETQFRQEHLFFLDKEDGGEEHRASVAAAALARV